jgi:hypothetical protein
MLEAPDVSERAIVGEPAYRSDDAPDAPAESIPVTATSPSDAPDRSISSSSIVSCSAR